MHKLKLIHDSRNWFIAFKIPLGTLIHIVVKTIGCKLGRCSIPLAAEVMRWCLRWPFSQRPFSNRHKSCRASGAWGF